MVKFNDLHISEDGKSLTVEIQVEEYDIYKDVYIKSVYLEYYKNRGTTGVPSDKAICLYEYDGEREIRALRKSITNIQLPEEFGVSTFRDGLFYVYVTCDGNVPASVGFMPCEYDRMTDIGVAIDWKMIYRLGMQHVSKFFSGCDPCDVPAGFEHFILMWNALKLSADTCDWLQLENVWESMIGVSSGKSSGRGCGCGR